VTIAADRIDTETVAARREERLLRLLERASASSRFNLGERWLFGLGGALVVAGFVAVIIGWVGASRTVLVAGQMPYLISGGLIGLGLIFVGGFLYFGHWIAVLVRESRERGSEDRDDLALVRRSLEDVNRSLQAVAAVLGASPAPLSPASLVSARATNGSARRGPAGTTGVVMTNGSAATHAPAAAAAPALTAAAPALTATVGSKRRSRTDDTVPVLLPALVATPTGSMVHRPECRAVAGRDNLRHVGPDDGLEPCGLCHPYESEGAG
jgi:hypothetical protein